MFFQNQYEVDLKIKFAAIASKLELELFHESI